jgi:gamma-glutamyltranspeptidase/glutathione hydrolase
MGRETNETGPSYNALTERPVAPVHRKLNRQLGLSGLRQTRMIITVTMMCVAGVLSADSPCHDDRLPAEPCVPEAGSDFGMVATGSPEATEAAVNVLERGGNAIDAAVAAALMLGVVDSDASGIGGSTNMVIHLANGRTLAVDGTSHAPMTIDVDNFHEFKESGRTYGHETIAVPTTLAALEYARARYGTMDLASLLQPAIDAAEHGYPLSKIQIIWTNKYYDDLMKSPAYMRLLTLEDGWTVGEPGDRQCQPDLANTLRRIAAEGVRSFYAGAIARQIEADMIRRGGYVRASDLSRVRIREVQPLHTTYRGVDVYSFPQPGGGAGAVAALNVLENFPSDLLAEDSVERHHLLIEAFRIAAADAREARHSQRSFGNDPLSKGHASDRSTIIVQGRLIPEELLSSSIPSECERTVESTTHVSVADIHGNVVSLTQTLSRSFGAKVATPGLGFPYNSFLESFNADKPQCPGYLQPNSPCTTDMAPTIVLKDGSLFLAVGTPGSNRIPAVIATVISNMVDRNQGVGGAVAAPRVLWGGMRYLRAWIELVDPITDDHVSALEKMGFEDMTVLRYPPPPDSKMPNFGGVNAVAYDPQSGIFTGIADPRRYGSAMKPRVVAAHE